MKALILDGLGVWLQALVQGPPWQRLGDEGIITLSAEQLHHLATADSDTNSPCLSQELTDTAANA